MSLDDMLLSFLAGTQLVVQGFTAVLLFILFRWGKWHDIEIKLVQLPLLDWLIASSLMFARRFTATLLTNSGLLEIVFDIDRIFLPLLISIFWLRGFIRLFRFIFRIIKKLK